MHPNELPARTRKLSTIPGVYRSAYIEDGRTGDFHLNRAILAVIVDGEAELARLRGEYERETADRDQKLARERTARQDAALRAAVAHELDRAGVDKRWRSAAAALLLEDTEFEFEAAPNGDAEVPVAKTPTGLKSVGALVADFLLTPDGAPYCPARSTAGEGYFAAMVAELKRGR